MSHFSVVPFAFYTCHNMVIANLLLLFWFPIFFFSQVEWFFSNKVSDPLIQI
jgi:hypothetical protein